MREIIKIEIDNNELVGTFHKPCGRNSDNANCDIELNKKAFVFFNFGQAPRSGHGDLAALTSDRIASLGLSVFRFDFPGLGDSYGFLPEREEDYWHSIENAMFEDMGVSILLKLQQKYNILRFILCGLCGGALTSLYVSALKSSMIDGVILLEPSFIKTPRFSNTDKKNNIFTSRIFYSSITKIPKLVLSVHSWIRFLSLKSDYSAHFKFIKFGFLRLYNKFKGNSLPVDMNFLALKAWTTIINDKIPSLVIVSDGPLKKTIDLVKKSYLNKKNISIIDMNVIKGTNHVFTTGRAKQKVIYKIEYWVKKFYKL